MPHSSKRPHSSSSTLLVLVGIVVTVMLVALFSMHSSTHWDDLDQKAKALSPVVSRQSQEDFKRLMEQTKQLLNDITAGNATLTAETIRDFKALTMEEKKMGEINEALERQLEKVETSLTLCTKGKYDAETARDTCQRDFKDYQHTHSLTQTNNAALRGNNAVKCPEMPVNVDPVVKSDLFSRVTTSLTTATATSKNKKWLAIGIPTVARRNDLDYLLKMLAALVDQLPLDEDDPWYHNILIHVINMQVNNDPGHRHVIFDKAKGLYGPGSGSPYKEYFQFSELLPSDVAKDPIPNRNAQNDPGTANVPGYLVRRQTRNIAYVMQRSVNLAKYYLFLEDDMMLCPQGFFAIQYLLKKASRYHPNWLAIRASYGMNGIFMHDVDLPVFAEYLLKHQKRRPPDHLVVEWYAGETPEAKQHKQMRANIGFKYNLFDHLGVVSTLRPQQQTSFPRCYDLLIEPTVFEVEAYNPRDCPRDDIWPCTNTKQPVEPTLIDWGRIGR